jgi:hypothetical protein
MDAQSLLSDLKLGLRAVFVLPLRRLFGGPDGLARFERSFFPERLLPMSLEDGARLREASRCLACGACDAAVTTSDENAGGHPERLRPSLLPSVFARSLVELPFAGGDVRRLASRPELLRAAERLCPTGVPLERLAGWLLRRSGAEG